MPNSDPITVDQLISKNLIDQYLRLGIPKKQDILGDELKGYWESDILIREDIPFGRKTTRNTPLSMRLLSFTKAPLSIGIKTELKWVLKEKIKNHEWSISFVWSTGSARLSHIVKFLSQSRLAHNSLMERSYSDLHIELRTWLIENNLLKESNRKTSLINKDGHAVHTFVSDSTIGMFASIYAALQSKYDDRPLQDRDIWDLSKLVGAGYRGGTVTVRFVELQPLWLKVAIKRYAEYCCIADSLSTVSNKINALKHFCHFIDNYRRNNAPISPSQFDRKVIVDWLLALRRKNHSNSVHRGYIGTTKQFIELCQINDWLPIPKTAHLFHPGDFPKVTKPLPRYIPESVTIQIDANIDKMPEPYNLPLRILRETGRRVSEVVTLTRECLQYDNDSDPFLKHYQYKMKKEEIIPISNDLAERIRLKLKQFAENSGDWLFPSANNPSKHINEATLLANIKQWGVECKILGPDGRHYNFQTHSFRHTVGTDMVNRGVPLLSVMRYLGHETPLMTQTYAKLHDKTLKETLRKFRNEKEINIAGEVVDELRLDANHPDMQGLKKHILEQSLANGRCSLPAQLSACPHANACLDCAHFRTSIEFLETHKIQLLATEHTISFALKNGMKRVVEMNTRIRDNLTNIIAKLEEEQQ